MAELKKTVSVRFSGYEKSMLDAYAKLYGKKQSDVLREAVVKMIENDQDFRLLEEAKMKTTRYYSLKEARKELEVEGANL
ncbi:MAG: hypothetical protein H6Q66_1562 [Firmicutes bacterium]|nr:hypothetical protein [Bacillota bacterium]